MNSKRAKRLTLMVLAVGLLLATANVTFAQTTKPTATPKQISPTAKPTTKATATAVSTPAANSGDAEDARPAGWREESHSNDVDPNYAVVFPADTVNQITITISAENWAAMQADMTELFGEPGTRGGFGGPGGGAPPQPLSPLPAPGAALTDTVPVRGIGQPPQPPSPLAGRAAPPQPPSPLAGGPPADDMRGGPGGFRGDFTTENPMWVTATISFAGDTWTNVGVRYKGNSSLRMGWDSKTIKLPFKFDFDEFEDDYPAINNQRFYGFKQLSLANKLQDNSYMRDAITYDLLAEAGLVSAETAFYEVSLDYGGGPVSLGVYTMIEVIDDTVIERAFEDDSGNIYEGDGPAASLAEGTFDQIEASFQKENNEDEADWSDIEALYTLLHSEERTADPDAWRTELEAIFDVDTFLEWLALSTVIEHWDTYGAMTHNFYLYHDPETDLLTWISWDHNLVLGANGGGGGMRPGNNGVNPPPTNNRGAGGGGQGGGGPRRSRSLDKADVDDKWPLIRYLLDDPTYYDRYVGYLRATLDDVFIPAQLTAQIEAYAEVLAPYAAAEAGDADFDTVVQGLIERIESRYEAVESFLATQ